MGRMQRQFFIVCLSLLVTIILPRSSFGSITSADSFEYNGSQSETPALSKIDDTHYLCVYEGPDNDGHAVVLIVSGTTVCTTTTTTATLEYDGSNGEAPALCKINDTLYLCAYQGSGDDGYAVVLEVDTTNWTITKGTAFKYYNGVGYTPALCKINDTLYLCAYEGPNDDGHAVVLEVDGTAVCTTIVTTTTFEYEEGDVGTPALCKINDTLYLCAYEGTSSDGFAVVLEVDTDNGTITKGNDSLEYDASNGQTPALCKIDSTHYLCAYESSGDPGNAIVLTVNLSTLAISIEGRTPYEYTSKGSAPALSEISSTCYLCAYRGTLNDGYVKVLAVNLSTWAISTGTTHEYDTEDGETPALCIIDYNSRYLCAYEGDGYDGYAVVLTLTDEAVELISFEAMAGYKEVMVSWQTEVEIDNKKWLIGRSTKEIEKEIEIIAEVPVKGVGGRYVYPDSLVEGGVTYWYLLGDISTQGDTTWHYDMIRQATPKDYKIFKFALHQNYPSPFRKYTTIRYTVPGKLPSNGEPDVSLKVYNLTGRLVRTLVLGTQKPGIYKVCWDGTDNSGKRVVTGIYFYCMETGKFKATKKLTILK